MSRKKKINVMVMDSETLPFKFGRVPEPICCELLSDSICEQFWGDDCFPQMIKYLDGLKTPHMIFVHNGGKFDFFFMLDHLTNPLVVINGRIVSAPCGIHQFRDSLAIIPVPLAAWSKMEDFDYSILEKDQCNKSKNKKRILEYLHSDCVNLLSIVTAFVDRFGPKLTVGSMAIGELKKFHSFDKMKRPDDEYFRPFYFGGRVECFRHGLLKGPFKLVDINSAYPNAMRNYKHPVNGGFDILDRLPDNFDMPFFARVEGINRGAIPVKTEDGLDFNIPSGEFHVCSHELKVALELGLFEVTRVIECAVALECISFERFVDVFYKEKSDCKAAGDKANEMFAKFILNSAYGKFGMNPDNFKDWIIEYDPGNHLDLINDGYFCEQWFPTCTLWSRKSDYSEMALNDVSIAASITSATRATLMQGLYQAKGPVYCDTDSIICEDFSGEMDAQKLGAWDLETTAEAACVIGKKLYMLYDPSKPLDAQYNPKGKSPNPVKMATKGGRLPPADMLKIARGQKIRYNNDAPSFSLLQSPRFISREFRSTVDLGEIIENSDLAE